MMLITLSAIFACKFMTPNFLGVIQISTTNPMLGWVKIFLVFHTSNASKEVIIHSYSSQYSLNLFGLH